MNLPSELQRLAPFLVVAVLALAGLFLVTRGARRRGRRRAGRQPVDAAGARDRAEERRPRRALTGRPGAPVGPGGQQGAQTLSFSGPFVEPASEDQLGTGRSARLARSTGDATGHGTRLSTGERGYVQVGGKLVRARPAAQAKRIFGEDPPTSKSLLEALGVDVQKWTHESARRRGRRQVGRCRHAPSRRGPRRRSDARRTSTRSSDGSGQAAHRTRDAAKQGEVELFVGKDDGLLRKRVRARRDPTPGPGEARRCHHPVRRRHRAT